jgi:hypothetical protein
MHALRCCPVVELTDQAVDTPWTHHADPCRRRDSRSVHEPHGRIAAGVTPQQVGVAGPGAGPAEGSS